MKYFDTFVTIGAIAAAVCVVTGIADYFVGRQRVGGDTVKVGHRSPQSAASEKGEVDAVSKPVQPQEAPYEIKIIPDLGLLSHLWQSALASLWQSALASGLAAITFGVVALAWPGVSILVAAILFGAYLLVSGIAQVVFAFSLHVSVGARMLLFISGVASLILAVLAFRHFGQGFAVLLLAIWIGVGFIFRGVATTISAISEPGVPGRGWNIFGVITLIAGIIVIAWPFESIVTLAMVVGISLIIVGVFEVVWALAMRTSTNNTSVKARTQSTAV